MPSTCKLLSCCLYFAANSLARSMTRLAEEQFMHTGLSPSHAFLLKLVLEQPGITPSELAASLHLAQSTVTRLTDTLLRKGLVEKINQGRTALISPTQAGQDMAEPIAKAWRALYERYSQTLGQAEGEKLTQAIHQACQAMDKA